MYIFGETALVNYHDKLWHVLKWVMLPYLPHGTVVSQSLAGRYSHAASVWWRYKLHRGSTCRNHMPCLSVVIIFLKYTTTSAWCKPGLELLKVKIKDIQWKMSESLWCYIPVSPQYYIYMNIYTAAYCEETGRRQVRYKYFCHVMNHKGNWLGAFLGKFWMNKEKFTRAGFEPATSGLTCWRTTNSAN